MTVRIEMAGIGEITGKYGVFHIQPGKTELIQCDDIKEAANLAGKEFTEHGGTVFVVEMLYALSTMTHRQRAEFENSFRMEYHDE